MIHGPAGSAAPTLPVLSTISSPTVGLLYLVVFGVGSAGGVMLMSALFGLPVYLTAARFMRAHLAVRGLAGLFSLSPGLFTVYEVGFVNGPCWRPHTSLTNTRAPVRMPTTPTRRRVKAAFPAALAAISSARNLRLIAVASTSLLT